MLLNKSPKNYHGVPSISDGIVSASKMVLPPPDSLLTIYSKPPSSISVYFFKSVGVVGITGLIIMWIGAIDFYLNEHDLKMAIVLFVSGIFMGLFGWFLGINIAKSFQKERDLNKWIYFSVTPNNIIYQFYDSIIGDLNRLVIEREQLLEIVYKGGSSSDETTPTMQFWYFLPNGEKQVLEIDYFFTDYDTWKKIEGLLSIQDKGISITVSPSEIVYRYIKKDSSEVESIKIPRNWITEIENCNPDGDPDKPVKIWYRRPDGKVKVQLIEFQFVYNGL